MTDPELSIAPTLSGSQTFLPVENRASPFIRTTLPVRAAFSAEDVVIKESDMATAINQVRDCFIVFIIGYRL